MSFGDGFKECANCAGKPGAPDLCEVCLHNRALAEERDGWRRDCIAAVEREHRLERLIARARKLMRLYFPRATKGQLPGVMNSVTDAEVRTLYGAIDTRARR